MRRPAGRAAVVGLALLLLSGTGLAYGASLVLTAAGLGAVSDDAVVIPKFTPTISGSPEPSSITLGQSAASKATLSGATTTASGTITHELYNGVSCATLVGSSTSTASGAGPTTSGTVKPAATGTYTWKLSYAGDDRNTGTGGSCGNGGTLTVGAAANAPSVTFSYPTSGVTYENANNNNRQFADKLTATVSGGTAPFTVRFSLRDTGTSRWLTSGSSGSFSSTTEVLLAPTTSSSPSFELAVSRSQLEQGSNTKKDYEAKVTVTDAGGLTASATVSFSYQK
jgi:hypothetical protein